MKAKLILLFFFISFNCFSQSDCRDALIACGNNSYNNISLSGPGNTIEINNNNSCSGQEVNSIWIKLNIKTSGSLSFNIVPSSNDLDVDFDFFLFGPNSDCENLGNAIRCSTTNPVASGSLNNLTGMNDNENDTSEGPGNLGNNFVSSLNVNSGESFFLVIDRFVGESNFDLIWTGTAQFESPPVFDKNYNLLKNIETCDFDQDNDNKTEFDFTTNELLAIGNQTNVSATFHISENDAQLGINKIINTKNYNNISNPQTVYIRLTNKNTNCYNISSFNLKVMPFIFNSPQNLYKCDQDVNGSEIFDLKDVTDFIKKNNTNLQITYFDSSNLNNQITTNLISINSGTVKTIWSKIKHLTCEIVKTFEIETINLPILNNNTVLSQCISNTSGYTIFNLNEIRRKISSNYLNESFTYFHTESSANFNNTNEIITNFENYTNKTPNSETIWVRVTNSNNCFSVVPFLIVISPSGAIYDLPDKEMHNCDDYLDSINDDYDGVTSFDLTNNYNYLVNFYNDLNIDIKFYKNENDYYQEFTNEQSLAITDLANYRNVGNRDNQSIWVRVENKLTNDCVGHPTTFKLVVEPKPNIDVNLNGDDNTHICADDPAVFQTLTAGLPKTENPNDYTYVWERDDTTTLPEVTPSISVNTAGKYKVIVSYKAGLQCSRSREILVKESNTAQIVGTPIIKDLVDNNSVTVTVTGDGNYVFALDDQFGPTQTTGYFDNLTPGIHTVFVIDLYGCAVLEVPVPIVGFPKYFTPNGDGYHDTWNIIGANSSFNANTKILIYNRYGKLLKEILPLGNGWDGHYLGKPVPADDYWFTAELKDGRNVKGHFTLKR